MMNSGCFMSLVLTAPPRLGLLCVWLFTWAETLASDSVIWQLLGFLILPYTTLFYLMSSAENGISILGWLLITGGVFLDLVAILGATYGAGKQAHESEDY